MRTRTAVAAVVLAGLLVPAAAQAQTTPSYPEPSNPGKVAPKPKPFQSIVPMDFHRG